MDSTDTQICFTQKDFKIYVFLLFAILGYLIYVVLKKQEELTNVDLTAHLNNEELRSKVKILQEHLYNTQLDEQKCQTELQVTKSLINQSMHKGTQIYNPLSPPNRIYVSPQNPILDDFQMIGYVYNNSEKYPLFGRYKNNRSDRWEYYIIDESRNRIKIPFKTKNDQELYDNDPIDIPTVGNGLKTKIYDYQEYRYNPNLV